MAQWAGMGSGRTHESRVQEIEASLRQAIAALHTSTEGDREAKAKNLHRLAKKLLSARVKRLKARYAEYSDHATAEVREKREQAIESMGRRIQELEEGGTVAILREFGVEVSVLESRSKDL